MCNGNCVCGKEKEEKSTRREPHDLSYKTNPATLEDESKVAYLRGFAEGFKEAREVFWEEFQVKASDANMVAKYLEERDKTAIEVDTLRLIASTYLHAADVLIMDRREYPGYKEDKIED